MTRLSLPRDTEGLNARAKDYLPGLLGIEFLSAEPALVTGRLPVSKALMAPNNFLHAASVIALVDTLAGFGAVLNLPEGAQGFTTVELKSNFMGTVRDGGVVLGEAMPVHLGRTTQIWDATAKDEASGKTIALFRCTQMILWPKEG
ncbi:MAG: PaaI family thioesterase [Pseudomonadota bacterium]